MTYSQSSLSLLMSLSPLTLVVWYCSSSVSDYSYALVGFSSSSHFLKCITMVYLQLSSSSILFFPSEPFIPNFVYNLYRGDSQIWISKPTSLISWLNPWNSISLKHNSSFSLSRFLLLTSLFLCVAPSISQFWNMSYLWVFASSFPII